MRYKKNCVFLFFVVFLISLKILSLHRIKSCSRLIKDKNFCAPLPLLLRLLLYVSAPKLKHRDFFSISSENQQDRFHVFYGQLLLRIVIFFAECYIFVDSFLRNFDILDTEKTSPTLNLNITARACLPQISSHQRKFCPK